MGCLGNADWRQRITDVTQYGHSWPSTETPEVGGPGGHVLPQVLGYQLTLFGPRGADHARHITTGPPKFLDDGASLE